MKNTGLIYICLLVLTYGTVNAQPDSYSDSISYDSSMLKDRGHKYSKDVEAKIYELESLRLEKDLKLDSAIFLKRKAVVMYRELNQFRKVAALSVSIGDIYYQLGNYSSATELFLQALAFYENDRNQLGIGTIYNSLGKVCYMSRQMEQAKIYFESARDIYQEVGDIEGLCKTYNNLGILASERDDIDLALDLFHSALSWAEELGSDILLGSIYGNIASGYYAYQEYDTVIYYIQLGLEILIEIEDWAGIAVNTTNLGLAYLKLKDYDSAERAIIEGLSIGRAYKFKGVQRQAYSALSELYSATGEFELAYKALARSDTIHSELIDERSQKSLDELSLSYENRLKENELIQLKADQRMQLRMNRIYLVIIVLAVLFFVAAIYAYLSIRRNNSLLGEKNKLLSDYNSRLITSEDSLKQMNEAKSRLFSIVAHDIRNPISAVEGFSALVYENFEKFSEAKKKEYIGRIYEGTILTRDLLENLLLWARSQMDKVEIKKEEVLLHDLIEQSIAPVLPGLEKKQIIISRNIQKNVKVNVDVEMLKAILRNLITNAMKFSHIGQEITISAELGAKDFCISVIDQGVGMEEEELKKLLTPRYSRSSTGTAGETGSGLGLLICKEYTEMNFGTISAESKLGRGSRFTVCFPLLT